MARLRQISAGDGGTGDDAAIRAHVIEEMVSQAPIIDVLEFEPISGNSTTVPIQTVTTGAGEMRTPGNDYIPHTYSPSEATSTLRIMGDKVRVDQAYQRRYAGEQAGNRFLTEAGKVARSIARNLVNELINGDNVSPNINGIKTLATGGQLLTAAANGLTVSLGNSDAAKSAQQTFLSLIDDLIANTPGCQMLIMNSRTIARLKAIGREYLTVTTVQDVFDRRQEVLTYNGLPIFNAGLQKDNATLVIPHTEVVGSSGGVCTSVYALTPGEGRDFALITSTGLSVKVHGLVAQNYEATIELDINTLPYSSKAYSRLQGLIIA